MQPKPKHKTVILLNPGGLHFSTLKTSGKFRSMSPIKAKPESLNPKHPQTIGTLNQFPLIPHVSLIALNPSLNPNVPHNSQVPKNLKH